MLISILIPAYNEEKTIKFVVSKIFVSLRKHKFEIIIVDDGSNDRTAKMGRSLEKKYVNVYFIQHKNNQGKTGAIKTALSYAKGDILVIQDADTEYHPKYLPRIVKPLLLDKVDVCFGSRFKGSIAGMKPLHIIGNKFLSWTTKVLFKFPTTDMETGYKAFKRNIIENIKFIGKGFELEPIIVIQIARMNCRFGEVPIDFQARQFGTKKISWRDGLIAFRVLVRNAFLKDKNNLIT